MRLGWDIGAVMLLARHGILVKFRIYIESIAETTLEVDPRHVCILKDKIS